MNNASVFKSEKQVWFATVGKNFKVNILSIIKYNYIQI